MANTLSSPTRHVDRLIRYVLTEKPGQAKGDRWVAACAGNGFVVDDNGSASVLVATDVMRRHRKLIGYVQGYHVIDSYAVDELDPDNPEDYDRAQKVGRRRARRLAKGRPFLVVTQIDGKGHKLHNHIVILSTHPVTGRAFDSAWVTHKHLAAEHDEILKEVGVTQTLPPALAHSAEVMTKPELGVIARQMEWDINKAMADEEGVPFDEERPEDHKLTVMKRGLRQTFEDVRSDSREAMVETAREHGLDLRFRGQGYSVSLLDEQGQTTKYTRRGATLGTDFSLDAMDAAIEANIQRQAELEAAQAAADQAVADALDEPALTVRQQVDALVEEYELGEDDAVWDVVLAWAKRNDPETYAAWAELDDDDEAQEEAWAQAYLDQHGIEGLRRSLGLESPDSGDEVAVAAGQIGFGRSGVEAGLEEGQLVEIDDDLAESGPETGESRVGTGLLAEGDAQILHGAEGDSLENEETGSGLDATGTASEPRDPKSATPLRDVGAELHELGEKLRVLGPGDQAPEPAPIVPEAIWDDDDGSIFGQPADDQAAGQPADRRASDGATAPPSPADLATARAAVDQTGLDDPQDEQSSSPATAGASPSDGATAPTSSGQRDAKVSSPATAGTSASASATAPTSIHPDDYVSRIRLREAKSAKERAMNDRWAEFDEYAYERLYNGERLEWERGEGLLGVKGIGQEDLDRFGSDMSVRVVHQLELKVAAMALAKKLHESGKIDEAKRRRLWVQHGYFEQAATPSTTTQAAQRFVAQAEAAGLLHDVRGHEGLE